MNGDGAPPPDAVVEDMAYLSRSSNRLQILDAIAAAARTPRDIVDEIGVPRSTLRRILTELEERGWADRTNDGEYVLTGTGQHVAAETSRYVGALQAIDELGDAATWLPNDELAIGLQHFREAIVRGLEPNDVVGADTRLLDLLGDADEFYCLTNTAGTVGLEKRMMDAFTDGGVTVENVITPDELAIYRRDPERAARWKEYVEAGADVYLYDGDIPCNLVVIDETVFLGDRRLESVGLIECTDESVRSWAVRIHESHREDAERIEPMAFDPERPAAGERHG